MSFGVKYNGRFVSLKGVRYRFDILVDGYVGTATEVKVSGKPITIKWREVDKIEPVQSSCATIELWSESDRQFVDLYTVVPGTIRLDIYRNDVIYWSGMLDTELYSEPYSYRDRYFVQFTFSDFAILERKKYKGKGFKTMRELLMELIGASGINHFGLVEHISTSLFKGSTTNLLDGISLQSQNFYDEDNEPMTLREVLDEVLRPWPMRLIQKNGKIHVYDLNALAGADPALMKWRGTDAVLENDITYNNVRLTFSPYEKTSLMDAEVDKDSVGDGTKVDVYLGTETGSADEKGFSITLSDQGEGLEKDPRAKFFKVKPVYSGSEDTGVAWTVKSLTQRNGTVWQSYLNNPSELVDGLLFRVPMKPYLSYVGFHRTNFRLKLSMEMMFDARYNPYEGQSKANEEGAYDRLQNWANFAYVPIKLTLRDDAGKAIYHFENYKVKDGTSFAHPGDKFGWVAGEAEWGNAWLCWYRGNRKNESGLGGWQTNKQIIGYYRGELPVLFDKMGNGEFIHLPSEGGYLDLEVGVGVPAYDYERVIKDGLYNECRWLLYRNPKIEIVDSNGKALKKKDIEYTAWIDRDAKEGLEIKTILGTMPKPNPSALGQLFSSADLTVRNKFYRAGVEDHLEKLMIGTVYSAYAGRHIALSGTAAILSSFGVYAEKNEVGKFLLLKEDQNLKFDTSNIKMVQFDADNFSGVEFEEE